MGRDNYLFLICYCENQSGQVKERIKNSQELGMTLWPLEANFFAELSFWSPISPWLLHLLGPLILVFLVTMTTLCLFRLFEERISKTTRVSPGPPTIAY